jgi:glycerol kinase
VRTEVRDTLIRERIGLLLDAYSSATNLQWLFVNVARLRERGGSLHIAVSCC